MPINKNVGIFENSGAILTKDGYIILAHASQANFNKDTCFQDYLIQHLKDVGINEMSKELKTTPEGMFADLLSNLSNDYAKKMVMKHFKERIC